MEEITNDEGATVNLNEADAKFYCSRVIQEENLPDCICGPELPRQCESCMRFQHSQDESVKNMFRKFDLNSNGVIERAEIKAVLSKIDPGFWTREKTDKMFDAADVNRDDLIDYEELLGWVFSRGELQEAVYVAAPKIVVPFDDLVVQELTWARTKPAEVAALLLSRRGQYKGKEYFPSERRGGCIVTKEGWAAVEDAIAFLKEQPPIGGVGTESSVGLALAGEDHVADIGKTGVASHASSDGVMSPERAKRYGKFQKFGECLWYGSEHSDARMMVLDLIVDDGVASRGHRLGVYNKDYDVVGVAYGEHITFGRMAAMEFAQKWKPSKEMITARIASGPIIPDEETIAKAKAEAGKRSSAPGTAWNLGTCPICKEPIKGGRVVEIAEAGGKMHASCFACKACSQPLTGVPYRVQKGSLFCSPCFAEEFGQKCVACGKAILGGMMKCSLGTFHIECLKCSQCDCKIEKSSRFDTSTGVMMCSACSSGGSAPARTGKAKAKPKSSPSPGPKRSASPGPKAKPKPKAKTTMVGAKSAAMGMAMDYAGLE